MDFLTNIYINEGVFISGNKEKIDITNILEKTFLFYIKLILMKIILKMV